MGTEIYLNECEHFLINLTVSIFISYKMFLESQSWIEPVTFSTLVWRSNHLTTRTQMTSRVVNVIGFSKCGYCAKKLEPVQVQVTLLCHLSHWFNG